MSFHQHSDTEGVTYRDFLKACRYIVGDKKGKKIERTEFAQEYLKTRSKKPYKPGHLRNMEEGSKPPGLELLEAAALAAGFTFEECIQLPTRVSVSQQHASAFDTFAVALRDERRPLVLQAALDLEKVEKIRRKKHGGRTRRR